MYPDYLDIYKINEDYQIKQEKKLIKYLASFCKQQNKNHNI